MELGDRLSDQQPPATLPVAGNDTVDICVSPEVLPGLDRREPWVPVLEKSGSCPLEDVRIDSAIQGTLQKVDEWHSTFQRQSGYMNERRSATLNAQDPDRLLGSECQRC